MSKELDPENKLAPIVIMLSNIIVVLVIFNIGLLILLGVYWPEPKPEKEIKTPVPDENGLFTEEARVAAKIKLANAIYWHAPDESELTSNSQKNIILYGKDIIAHTSDYFGNKGKIFKASTNGMNCQNCHLDAGKKIFGNNYSAVASTYPKLRERSGTVENIYKRVNDCFERSLNGNGLDTNSKEMQAVVAYINWLGKDVKKGIKPEGAGLKSLAFLDRAADPEKGKNIYASKCQSCHQPNGEGLLNTDKAMYTYPPLWGNHSYNNGAGLFRLSNFAKYVKYNMPLSASYETTQITDEEAWDVAAFVNSQPRPKKDITKDWPITEQKPFDHPFGPYKDGFNEIQHKYGPFKPIKEKLDQIKKNKKL